MATRRLASVLALGVAVWSACLAAAPAAEQPLRVGSKRFTESYILGEIAARTAGAEHKPGLGNTAILLSALKAGAIDLYPEYTGTIARELLGLEQAIAPEALAARLAEQGLAASIRLGFSNGYALGMRSADAERLGIRRVSDLAGHPGLRFGLSHEFLGRRDGWPGLRSGYALPHSPRGLDHGIAYEALAEGRIDVLDLYTTDAKIARYAIRVLEDDRGHFPSYEAVLLHRLDLPARWPEAYARLRRLEGSIDAPTMVRLNARAELEKVAYAQVAAEHLGGTPSVRPGFAARLLGDDFLRLLLQHAGLVAASVAAAVLAGVPLGIGAARRRWLAQPVLAATGLVQVIPSLALLAVLIPVTGSIGIWPALIALFLYALLPITLNTYTGLSQVPRGLVQAGTALGLNDAQVLCRIELPLALPTLLAGVRTSATVSVGTATIAAFIGAGGFGERIAQGLALNDHSVLLAGALPAALLALAVHLLFEGLERRLPGAGGGRPRGTG